MRHLANGRRPLPDETSPDVSEFARHKRRAERIWTERGEWDSLTREAYDFAIPSRRPGGRGTSKRTSHMLFDMTAPTSVMYGAQTLVQQLFGTEPFHLEAGPLIKARFGDEDVRTFNRQMGIIKSNTLPFFLTGDFDGAMHETAIDLFIGTGAIIPMRGPSIEEPLVFVNVPFEFIACGYNRMKRPDFISWRQYFSHEEILSSWPTAKHDSEWLATARKHPSTEVQVWQNFVEVPGYGWRFVAYTDKSKQFMVDEFSVAQPIAVPRFYKAPREPYGRGPLLQALPSIRVLNHAQKLVLEGAAIAMLGLWAYRSGGTFNPNAARLAPGEFWPMDSTGGFLGPDVQRLDPPNNRLDIGRLIVAGERQQVRDALMDSRIHDDGGTPPSASEISARLAQDARKHAGAFGRLTNELLPVVVPRSIEILNEWGILRTPIPKNPLIYGMSVRSPMMQALKADKMQASVNYAEVANSLVGPDMLPYYVSLDRTLDRVRDGMLIEDDIVPTEQERQAFLQQRAQTQMAQQAGAMAERAAPQLVQLAGGGRAAA